MAVRYFTTYFDGSNVVEQSGNNYSHSFDSFVRVYTDKAGQNMLVTL